MKKAYSIWIVSPYSHSECFREVAQSLQAAFIALGHECAITTTSPIERENVILLGAHLLHPNDMLYLKSPIVWQLEQMPDESDEARAKMPWTDTYLTILRSAGEVWDYSRLNIETLTKHGIEAKLLEVGYSKCLSRIENTDVDQIDVLFLGAMNKRRAHILSQLQEKGAKVVHAYDCYGMKRDVLVARAKIILNVHHYNSKIWEIVRCSYMMSNRKCVVSEKGLDLELEKPYYGAVSFTEYDGLVDECMGLLRDDDLRGKWAQAGFDRFKEKSQVEFLKRVLQ